MFRFFGSPTTAATAAEEEETVTTTTTTPVLNSDSNIDNLPSTMEPAAATVVETPNQLDNGDSFDEAISPLETSVSSNPGTAPTIAPEPARRLSYKDGTDACFKEVQQGFQDPKGRGGARTLLEMHRPTTPKTLFTSNNNTSSHVHSDSSTEDLPKMMMAVSSSPPPSARHFRDRSRRKSRSSRRSSSSSLSHSLLLDGYDEGGYGSSGNIHSPVAMRRRSSQREFRRSSSHGNNRPIPSPVIISPSSSDCYPSNRHNRLDQNHLYSSPELSSESSPDSSPNRMGMVTGMHKLHQEQQPRPSSTRQQKRYYMKQGSFSSNSRISGNMSDPSNSSLHTSAASAASWISKSSNSSKRFLSAKSWCLAGTFVGMVVLSLSGMVLLTNQAAVTVFHEVEDHSINRPDMFSSAAGLRGKMVQGRWDDKHPIIPSASVSSTTKKAETKPFTETKPSTKKVQPATSITKETKQKDKHQQKPTKKGKVKPTSASVTKKATSDPKTKTNVKGIVRPPKLEMHLPPPLSLPEAKFEKFDPTLYRDTTTAKGVTPSSRQHPRMVMLDPSVTPVSRKIKVYPADFTDNTQFYGILPSDDERLSRMEIRAPYSEGECVPMQDWQTTFHPFCNGMHELALETIGGDGGDDEYEKLYESGLDAQLFGTKGFWRYAWRLDLDHYERQKREKDTIVLKTLKFEHNFEDAHFEHDRVDAVAMERLTSSPHVINIFGFCGHSVLTEYADGSRVGELADKARKMPLERLRIARDIAAGLADVHGIDGDGNATFVHLDVNPANVVSIGGTLKLNDFNIGIIRRWNTTANEPCGFPAQYPNPQWRSPEEARNEQNLTEKVDIFSMGHIFFRLICGHEPWNKLEPGGKPSKEVINRKVQRGELPFIPDHVRNSENPEVIAIRDAMLSCYKYDPKDRPSAREIADSLGRTLKELSHNPASDGTAVSVHP